jgi:multidrug transporter EmrE-like cation transporter
MSLSALGLSLVAALCFVAGGAFMKLSSGFERPGPGVLALGLFLAGAVAQTLAMKHGEMGVSYVFILGLEAVLAFAIGAFLFRESVSAPKLLGVALIIGGFALLHASTTVGTH